MIITPIQFVLRFLFFLIAAVVVVVLCGHTIMGAVHGSLGFILPLLMLILLAIILKR